MSTRAHNARKQRGGFSLVELAASTAALIVVLGAILMMGVASNRAYRAGAMDSVVESQLQTALERIVTELMTAGLDVLPPDPPDGHGLSELEYRQAIDVNNGAVVWSTARRLAFEIEPGEIDDGLDNDGDEMVDEGQVVLVQDAGTPDERRLILTRWVPELLEGEEPNEVDDNGNRLVDERGFAMQWIDESLVVHLTLSRRDSEGVLWRRTAQTAVRIRN
jgi:hypothetical protein